MQAMILAAGEGTRLRPLTFCRPKVLVPILTTPIIHHTLHWLAEQGVREVVTNLYHLSEQVESYLGDGSQFGVQIAYSREDELLGPAGGVKKAAWFFQEEEFLVVGGDDLIEIDIEKMRQFHEQQGALATISVTLRSDVWRFGVVDTDGNGRILRFLEKPNPDEWKGHGLVNTGVYLFQKEVLDLIPSGFYDFGSQLFPLLAERSAPIYAFQHGGYWCDVGSIESYVEANRAVLEGAFALWTPLRQVQPGMWMGENVHVDPQASLQPPCALGDNCVIEKRGQVNQSIIGSGCIIQEGARVEESILWMGVTVERGVTLKNCIVTDGCYVALQRAEPNRSAELIGSVIAAPGAPPTQIEGCQLLSPPARTGESTDSNQGLEPA